MESRIALAPHARVFDTQWAWSSWPETQRWPQRDGESHIFYRSGTRVILRQLSELEALILTMMVEPIRLQDLIAGVTASVDAEPPVLAELPGYIADVLRNGLAAGFAELVA